MPGRIITLQRQVRELGRLRAGLTVDPGSGKRPYPQASKTWIVTSLNRAYVEAAAEIWGGTAEPWQPLSNRAQEWRVITQRPTIDAILPPGDPISQAYEMWTAGGCQRRCDGETEARTQEPCLCRAQFGDNFHEVPVLGPDKKPQRCSINTRLSVFLPELPDIGIWRVETGGYWPSVHITGYVETIKGLVGPQVMVPVTLSIEPKTKVRDGKTSHYVEIVVALKERASFGQIVAAPEILAIGGPADKRTIDAAPERTAIGPATQTAEAPQAPPTDGAVDWKARFATAPGMPELRRLWTECGEAGALDAETKEAWFAAGRKLRGEEPETAAAANPVGGTPYEGVEATVEAIAGDAEQEPDREATWSAILAEAGKRGWSTAQTSAWMRETVGHSPVDADGWTMGQALEALKSGAGQ